MYILLPFFFDSFNKFAIVSFWYTSILRGGYTISEYISRKMEASSNILYNNSEVTPISKYIPVSLLFTICLLGCYTPLFTSSGKNKLNISEIYRDSITFRTNTMHTPTNFDQTDRTETA